MYKEVMVILFLVVSMPLLYAQEQKDAGNVSIEEIRTGLHESSVNAWNESVILSPTWQKLIGTFFGFNLKKVSTNVSIREAMVLIIVFLICLIILYDIAEYIPLFDKKILFIPSSFLVSFILTSILALTGSFISLKDLFLKGVEYVVTSLNWQWLSWSTRSWWGGLIISAVLIIILFLIRELLDWLSPLIKKYAAVSRAKALGEKQSLRNKEVDLMNENLLKENSEDEPKV